METNNQIYSEKIFYDPSLSTNSNEESIEEVVFKVTELMVLILSHAHSALRKCTQLNKTFRSAIYEVPQLRLALFLENAKQKTDSMEKYYGEVSISKIALMEASLSIKEAKMTLQKITEYKVAADAALIEIVKKALENNQLEEASNAADEIFHLWDKFKAWLMIVNHKKTEENIKKCVTTIEEMTCKPDAALANLQLWNVTKNDKYFLNTAPLLTTSSLLERFGFCFELSKMDPTTENIQKLKEQLPLFSDNPPESMPDKEIVAQFAAAIEIAREHQDKAFMSKIKEKLESIENPSIKWKIWRRVCDAEPSNEKNFEEAILLIEHASHKRSQAETCIQFFKLTKKTEYLDKASTLADQVDPQHWKNLTWLKIVKIKSEHELINTAKKDVEKIESSLYLKTLAWIAIWKGEKTSANLQKVISQVMANEDSKRPNLWIELAQAQLGNQTDL